MSTAPVSPNIQPITKNTLEIPRSAASLSGISIGETLPATILEKLSANKYLLALKNLQIPATSAIPLSAGEKLTVKVSSLQPQIVLNIMDGKVQAGDVKVNEKLLQWRSNPESLLQVIAKVSEFAKLIQTVDLPLKISNNDIEKLIKLFDNIIFSPRTKNNPLFLKEFVSKTGLLLENTLKQLIAEASKGTMGKPIDDNLKTLLLKLSSAIQDALKENSKQDLQITAKLANISAFADEALQAIEAKQVLNTVFQDSDNGLVLQIPLALADGFRQADIFITPEEKDGQGKKKFSSCSIAIFLDLDILGKIVVNAGVREGGFSCVIKCESEEVKDLISDKIDELKNSLSGTGYLVNYIDCVQETGLMQQKEEFLERQSFSTVDLVNFFV